jgi:hypothetical protein
VDRSRSHGAFSFIVANNVRRPCNNTAFNHTQIKVKKDAGAIKNQSQMLKNNASVADKSGCSPPGQFASVFIASAPDIWHVQQLRTNTAGATFDCK